MIGEDREAAAIDRIEAFRRRRPRLKDDYVTLAHGAGGKASAALVDTVFLEAFGRPADGMLADAATLELPGGARLVVTTSSSRCAFREARSGTSRCTGR
jgi:hydrogenase expression/formation protein HypE